jgi:hypothetical protein
MFKRSSATCSDLKLTEGQPHVDFEELSRQTGVSIEELRALASSFDEAQGRASTATASAASLDQFAADYARLQSPAYQRLARKAEQSVVGKLGFRRFGQKG